MPVPGRGALCAVYNLARYLTEDGQYREAAELLALDEGLYRGFPEAWTQLRLSWLQGKIAAGLTGEGLARLKTIREGFLTILWDFRSVLRSF